MPNGLFLSFDFGTKYIGVAVGQEVTTSARPLAMIKNNDNVPDWTALELMIQEWKPEALIVGLPLKLDGAELPITPIVLNFADQLNKKFKLPVHLVDERLTTKAAKEEIFTQQGYKGLTKENVNSMAAKLILENWLRQQSSK